MTLFLSSRALNPIDRPVGAVFFFADGHCSFVTDTVEQRLYKAQSTIKGREPLP